MKKYIKFKENNDSEGETWFLIFEATENNTKAFKALELAINTLIDNEDIDEETYKVYQTPIELHEPTISSLSQDITSYYATFEVVKGELDIDKCANATASDLRYCGIKKLCKIN